MGFLSTVAIKQQRRLKNLMYPTMVCSCRNSYLDLPVSLVDFQVEGCPLCLRQVCQGGYLILYYIDFEEGDRKICRNRVDNIEGGVR